MTDARPTPRRRGPRRPGPLPVVAASLAIFLTVFALLAWQMSVGRDPALGAAGTAVALTSPQRTVLVRRVIVTRRLVVVKEDGSTAMAPGTAVVSSPAASGAAPVVAIAPAAPGPTAAPAPAPVVTRTS
jgi:hypothetical protein